MYSSIRQFLFVCLLVATIGAGSHAFAFPTNVSITPPDDSRFLASQRFDIRVEGQGKGPFSATLMIDGVPHAFTSGVQNSNTTDGITVDGWGGFNLRGYSNRRAGIHTVKATFTDATGTITISAQFEIIDPVRKSNLNRSLSQRDETKAEQEINDLSQLAQARGQHAPIKNIIILLGDGMGVAHRTAARLVKYGVTAGRPNGFLAMDQFPGLGLVTTHSLNSIITDSAPGMAGYTTGSHFNNNQEGVNPAHVTNPFYNPRVEYLSEYLHRVMGKSLGLVTTADVEDATPAANAVHTSNRGAGTGICDQYLDESDSSNTGQFGTGLSVLMGGGRRWFLPATQFGSSRSAATDYANLPTDLVNRWHLSASAAGAADPNRDLLQDFKSAGFAYADNLTALNNAMSGDGPNKLLGLFGYGNMNTVLDKLAKRRGTLLPGTTTFAVDDYHAPDQPMLDEMTAAALRVLSKNDNGFVLMVEGAHIDKQAHAMDADRVIDETIEFDNAVAVCRSFADVAGDTLVIILADHECAGFSLIGALTGGISNLKNLADDHQTLDPNTQPGRQKVVGVYDAAGFPSYAILPDGYPQTFDIDGKLLVGFGANGDRYESWLQKPLPIIDSLLPTDIRNELTNKGYPGQPYQRAESQSGFFIRGQAIGKDQAVHTAADIPISAHSSGSTAYQLFSGVQENTDVFFKLMRAVFGGY